MSTGGHVHNYWPLKTTLSEMKPGVKRLAVSWNDFSSGAYNNTPPYL